MTFTEYIEILDRLTKAKAELLRDYKRVEEPVSEGIDALVDLLAQKKKVVEDLTERHNLLEKMRDQPGFDQQELSDVFMQYWAAEDTVNLLEKQIKKFTNQQQSKAAGYSVTEELIEEVKDLISIPMMCKQQDIRMRRSGADKLTIICPFHDEDTPSCMIYVEQDSWWCFGCNQGGDVLKFYMLLTELDFIPAMHQLVEKLGLVVIDVDEKKERERARIQESLDYVESEILRLKQVYSS